MNAPDTNLLIYAYHLDSPFHTKAMRYLQHSLSADALYGIPVLCIHGFVRIVTGPAFGSSRLSLAAAYAITDSWLQQPNVKLLMPGSSHWQILQNLSLQANTAGPTFTDAAIAAIAIEHDATIHSTDSDFARFTGLRWHNPLED